MTAETLHDAISLLPPDLVAEADRLRRSPVRRLSFRKIAAIAASLALVVCVGGFALLVLSPRGGSSAPKSAETAMDFQMAAQSPAAAPAEREQAGGTLETASASEMEMGLDVEYRQIPAEIAEATVQLITGYDQMLEYGDYREERWFEDHDLILLLMPDSWVLEEMEETEAGWVLHLTKGRSLDNCILIDIEKGLIRDALDIRLNFR